MQINKFIRSILIIMLIMFVLGAGVSFYKNRSKSVWTEDGIQGLKEGCNKMGLSSAFCDCYTDEIVSRISMKDFNELTENIQRSELDTKKAKDFIDPVIAHCSESNNL